MDKFRALVYTESSLLMATDFRDIIFQSDPFLYHVDEWRGNYQLVLFKEFHPNMVQLHSLACTEYHKEIISFLLSLCIHVYIFLLSLVFILIRIY